MRIPYIKEILLVCIGLNISHFTLSVAMGSASGMWLATACTALCGFGIWFKGREEEKEE